MVKKESPLVSLIIPTYNDQSYINAVISSSNKFLEGITHEIIVVDDGSTDETVQVVKQLRRHYHIRLFQQDHYGVSVARNLGIDRAQGKYLMFCDGDDRLVGQLPTFDDADIISFSINCKQDRTITADDKLQLVASMFGFGKEQPDFPAFYGGSVSKLFSRALIQAHHLTFNAKLANSEDILFNTQAICAAQKIEVKTQEVYLYCHHCHSVTHSYDQNLLGNHCYLMKQMEYQLSKLPNHQSLYQRVLSLYLYQLVYRQFAFSNDYRVLYHQWINSTGQKKWNEHLARPIERVTIKVINTFGIVPAVILARCYLGLKQFIKGNNLVNERL